MDVVFGYGQVGQALVRELVGRGRRVRVVSRTGGGPEIAGVDHVAGDATSPSFCRAMCAGAEVVYLCLNAPYDRWAVAFPPLQAAVVAGAEEARCKLVVLENLYMYGPQEGPLTESLAHAATDEKGRTRAHMSEALLAAHRAGKVRVAIGRAADFFGPGVTMSWLGERAFRPLLGGKAVSWIGHPDTRHSFAYVPDVARALATLGERSEADGGVWHLPCVETMTTRALLARAGAIAGTEVAISVMPEGLLSLLSRVHPMLREIRAIAYQLTADFVVDASRFESTFGVNATPIDEALTATVAWYRARKPKASRVPRALGLFMLDNLLIGLAAVAVGWIVTAVPSLSSLALGIAAAAGLYWLPLLRRRAISLMASGPSRPRMDSRTA